MSRILDGNKSHLYRRGAGALTKRTPVTDIPEPLCAGSEQLVILIIRFNTLRNFVSDFGSNMEPLRILHHEVEGQICATFGSFLSAGCKYTEQYD